MLNAEIPSERIMRLGIWIMCALARPNCPLAFLTHCLPRAGGTNMISVPFHIYHTSAHVKGCISYFLSVFRGEWKGEK